MYKQPANQTLKVTYTTLEEEVYVLFQHDLTRVWTWYKVTGNVLEKLKSSKEYMDLDEVLQ